MAVTVISLLVATKSVFQPKYLSWVSDQWTELLPVLSNSSLTSNSYSTNHLTFPKAVPYTLPSLLVNGITTVLFLSVYFIFTLSVFNCGLHHLLSRLLKLSPKLFPFNLAPKTIYLPNYHQNEGFNNSVMFFPVCCTFQWPSIAEKTKGHFLGIIHSSMPLSYSSLTIQDHLMLLCQSLPTNDHHIHVIKQI